jgi:hypothetical protein
MLITFWKNLKEPYSLVHQQFYQNIAHAPNRSTSLEPELQNKNKCAPLDITFSVYIHGNWTLGRPYAEQNPGAIGNILWSASGNSLGIWCEDIENWKPFGDMIGTHWEQGGEKKSLSPFPLKKKKNCNIHECVLICFFVFLPCSISAPANSRGQIWWPTVLKTKNTCGQWVGWSMRSKCLDFFSFKFWVARMGGGFFSFFLCSQHVPSSSQWVPIKCPMSSQWVPKGCS